MKNCKSNLWVKQTEYCAGAVINVTVVLWLRWLSPVEYHHNWLWWGSDTPRGEGWTLNKFAPSWLRLVSIMPMAEQTHSVMFVEWAADRKVNLTLASDNNYDKHGAYELELVNNDWDHSTNYLSHIIYPKHCSMKTPPKSLPTKTTIRWSRTLNPSLPHYRHPPQSHWYLEGGHPHLPPSPLW